MIFVTGTPRSGTSLTCQVLESCGAEFGAPLKLPNERNARGYYEHTDVKLKVLSPLLKKASGDGSGYHTVPPRDYLWTRKDAAWLRRRLVEFLGGASAYKDPRLLFVWRVFRNAFPDARWVIVRRSRDQILGSIEQCKWMVKRLGTAERAESWIDEYNTRIDDLFYSDALSVEVWPDPSKPRVFKKAVRHAGLDWDEQKVSEVIDPELWNVYG